MSTIRESISEIRLHIKFYDKGKPQRLSVASGMHRNTLNSYAAPKWNPNSRTIEKVVEQIRRERKAALKKTVRKGKK